MRGLNHVMNYVIMDFSCLLFSFMSFVVAELVNAFVLYKNTPDCNFAIFKVFVMSLIALFFILNLMSLSSCKYLFGPRAESCSEQLSATSSKLNQFQIFYLFHFS